MLYQKRVQLAKIGSYPPKSFFDKALINCTTCQSFSTKAGLTPNYPAISRIISLEIRLFIAYRSSIIRDCSGYAFINSNS